MSINNLGVEITGNSKSLVNELEKADDKVKQTTKNMESSLGGMSSAFSKLGTLFKGFLAYQAVQMVFSGIANSINEMIESSKKTQIMSERLGMTAIQAAALSTILEDAGTSADAYMSTITKMTMGLKSNEDRFKELGIATRDQNGNLLSSQQIMQNSINVINEHKAGIDRDMLAMELYGKNVDEVIKINNAMSQSLDEEVEKHKALSMTLSGDKAIIDEYKEAKNSLGDVMQGVGNTIARYLMPIFSDFAKWFIDNGPEIVNFTKKIIIAFTQMKFAVEMAFAGILGILNIGKASFQGFAYIAISAFQSIGQRSLTPLQSAIRQSTKIVEQELDASAKRINKIKADVMKDIAQIKNQKEAPKEEAAAAPSGGKSYTPTKIGGGASDIKAKQKELDDAKLAVINARIEAEIALLKEQQDRESEINDDLFNRKIITVEQFYAKKAEMINKDAELEKKELERKLAQNKEEKAKPGLNKSDELKLKAEQIKLEGELMLVENQRANNIAANADKLNADLERRQKSVSLQNLEIAKANEEAKLDIKKTFLDQELAMGNINQEQMLKSELQMIDAQYLATLDYYEKKKTLYAGDVEALSQIHAEIEKLEIDHKKRLKEQESKIFLEQNKDQIAMVNTTKQAFSTMMQDIVKSPKNFKDAMMNALNTITNKMLQMAADKIIDKIFTPSSGGGGGLGDIFGSIFNMGGSSGGSSGASSGGGLGGILSSIGGFLGFLDTGTNYVPQDGLAYIHKGEAVVPAKYNNSQNQGGKSTNVNNVNNFILQSAPDRRTQMQIAASAGAGVNSAIRRNN